MVVVQGNRQIVPSPTSEELDMNKPKRRRLNDIPVDERLFVATRDTGLVYCDRAREQHGDYMQLAYQNYRTLELQWYTEDVPAYLRDAILFRAKEFEGRRGERYALDYCQSVVITLGQ